MRYTVSSRWLPLLCVVGIVVAGSPLAAQAPVASPPSWADVLKVNVFVSTTYSYNFNHPDSHLNTYHLFDTDERTWTLDVAELVVQKEAVKPGDTGFRVDLEAGQTIPRNTAAFGLFRDENGKAGDFDLQQAYVSWIAPVGQGLRIDVGKMATFYGVEVIEGYDGWNDNASHSFLFSYAEPVTHTGVRATLPLGSVASVMATVTNGWDCARDVNTAQSFGGQLALFPHPTLTILLNAMVGPEQRDNTKDTRSLYGLVALWKPSPRVSLGLNADVGTEQNAAPYGRGDASWRGAAVYARWNSAGRFSLALRGERFRDRDGARTSNAQTLDEVTLTPELRLGDDVVVRLDLRLDRSDVAVFEREDRFDTRQRTAILNVLYHH
jgi:hypothetical protein